MKSSKENSAIGLFDSGVGGLTVLKSLKAALPNEHFVYLGDTARNPYGPKSQGTILAYSKECLGFLEKQDVKLIVVACNSASSAALPALEDQCSVPIIGVIDPLVKQAVEITKLNSIGVIGTQATISSRSYLNAIHALRPNCQVVSKACPLFVPLVEEGIFEGPIVDLTIERYLSSLRQSGIDTLILGCTHYPLLKSSLVRYLGEKIKVLSSGEAVSLAVRSKLEESNLLSTSSNTALDRFFVTDTSEQFERVAAPLLELNTINAVQVHSL